MRRSAFPLFGFTVLAGLLAAEGFATPAASLHKYPYCGESFLIERSDDEAIQFIGESPRYSYFLEIAEGVFTLAENPEPLPAETKLTQVRQTEGVTVSRLTLQGKATGYLFEDANQRMRALLTGESLKGDERDFRVLRRFDFSASRKGRCARVIAR